MIAQRGGRFRRSEHSLRKAERKSMLIFLIRGAQIKGTFAHESKSEARGVWSLGAKVSRQMGRGGGDTVGASKEPSGPAMTFRGAAAAAFACRYKDCLYVDVVWTTVPEVIGKDVESRREGKSTIGVSNGHAPEM